MPGFNRERSPVVDRWRQVRDRLKAAASRADPAEVTPAALAPKAGDATSLGVVRLCAGFAVVHAANAVLGLALSEVTYRAALVSLDTVCAVVFALLAFLASTQRLPGWRRETTAAFVTISAASAAAVRTGLLEARWPASELVLAAAAACVITVKPWFWSVLGACGVLWAGSVVAAGTRTGFDANDFVFWLNVGLMIAAAAALAASIRRARTASAIALVEAHHQLLEQSVRDPLTGLANQKGLQLVARPMIDLARRQGQAVHCLVVDVDTLRELNEEHGVREGDEVLLAVAEALKVATRTTDVVARWGGDEFVLLGPGTGMSPLEMERRLRAHLSTAITLPRTSWQGRVSAGVATLVPWDSDNLESLLERAIQDMALRRTLKRKAAARIAEEDIAEPVRTAGPAATPGTGGADPEAGH